MSSTDNNTQLFQYGNTTADLPGPYGDDSASPPLTLTTPFTFFGKQHTEIIVSTVNRFKLHETIQIAIHTT